MAGEGGAIDSLSIEIGASSDEAVTKINNIVSALKELKSLSRLSIPTRLIGGMKELSGAMESITPDKISRLHGIGSALKSFSEIGKISIPASLSENLFNLAAAASMVSADQIRNLNALGDAIKNGLGNMDSTFSENIRNVGNALTYFTNIKTGSINKSLPSQLAELGTVIRQFDENDLVALNSVSGALSKLGGTGIGISKSLPEHLQSLMDAVSRINDADIVKLERLAIALNKLSGVDLKGMKGASGAFKGLGSGESSRGLKESADSLNKSVIRATQLYKIVNSFGRIAFYRLIRSAIKAVTDALTEGTKNAFNFSKAFESHQAGTLTIAQAYDQLASASFKMSNQLGSAWASLVRAIQPMLIQILQLVTKLADAMAQLFSLFGGRSTYLKAIDYNKQWGDSAAGAAAATEEWKNQLLGFDEINRLEAPSTGGGGGGGGVGDIGNMFEETEVSDKIKGIFDKIQSGLQWIKEHLDLIRNLAIAIGIAFLTWKLATIIDWLRNMSGFLQKALGFAMMIAGAFLLVTGAIDAWKNGVNWDNLIEILAGVALVAGGLAIVFGGVAAAVFLIIAAIAMLVIAVRDWIKTGELTVQSFMMIEAAILSLGIALTILTGSWIPLVVAVVVAAVAAIVYAIVSNWDSIKAWFQNIRDTFVSSLTETKEQIVSTFQQAGEDLRGDWERTKEFFTSSMDGIKEAFANLGSSLRDQFRQIGEDLRGDMERLKASFQNALNSIKQGFVNAFNAIKNTVSNIINSITSMIQRMVSSIQGFFSMFGSMGGSVGISTPRFASGGFPEDGLFMANHGELVGRFANGKTAVANNSEITAGIARAVYDAFSAAISDASSGGGGGKNTEFVLNINGREFARAVYNDQQAVAKERGTSYLASA